MRPSFVTILFYRDFQPFKLNIDQNFFINIAKQWKPKQINCRVYSIYSYCGIRSIEQALESYIKTELIPNGSDPKRTETNTPFVYPFPIGSDFWTCKKAGSILEPFRLQMGLAPSKHLDWFISRYYQASEI